MDYHGSNKKIYHLDRGFFEKPSRQDHIFLCQIGDLYCGINYYLERHKQIVYEITYVCSGKGVFYIDGQPYFVRKGDVILNKPGEYHEGKADSVDPFRYFYIGFMFYDEGNEEDPIYHKVKNIFDTCTYPVAGNNSNIEQAFIRIYKEIVEPDEYSNILIRNYINEIILVTARSYGKKGREPGEYEIKQDLIDEIINYIDLNSDKLIKVSEISRDLGYSSSYISHLFSRKMGMSIKDYCDNLRLEKALKLLKESDVTVSELADRFSYSSVHSFSKAVKAKYGMSPSSLRNDLEEENLINPKMTKKKA
jgi:AraC-type DNA-binding domain-containing proteins